MFTNQIRNLITGYVANLQDLVWWVEEVSEDVCEIHFKNANNLSRYTKNVQYNGGDLSLLEAAVLWQAQAVLN